MSILRRLSIYPIDLTALIKQKGKVGLFSKASHDFDGMLKDIHVLPSLRTWSRKRLASDKKVPCFSNRTPVKGTRLFIKKKWSDENPIFWAMIQTMPDVTKNKFPLPTKELGIAKNKFYTGVEKLSGIYVFSVGKVGDLRENGMKIPIKFKDENYVYKAGRTENLEKRGRQHQLKYKRFSSADVNLVKFSPLDYRFQSSAERDFMHSSLFTRNRLDGIVIKEELQTEIFTFDASNQKSQKELDACFSCIQEKYGGSVGDMLDTQEKKHSLEMDKMRRQLAESDNRLSVMNERCRLTNEVLYMTREELTFSKNTVVEMLQGRLNTLNNSNEIEEMIYLFSQQCTISP
jgi:hypothetical protein